MNSIEASARRNEFVRLISDIDLDERCRLAVEMYDDVNHLQMALGVISKRCSTPPRAIKERMLHHAGIVGYDNSEDLVRRLNVSKL